MSMVPSLSTATSTNFSRAPMSVTSSSATSTFSTGRTCRSFTAPSRLSIVLPARRTELNPRPASVRQDRPGQIRATADHDHVLWHSWGGRHSEPRYASGRASGAATGCLSSKATRMAAMLRGVPAGSLSQTSLCSLRPRDQLNWKDRLERFSQKPSIAVSMEPGASSAAPTATNNGTR